jgi:4-hydroxybutyryl-CoA dehydratase/vinylacetyl-CoA-Delta-isomerase
MENDYDCFWAMMNPKGDRSKKLNQQESLPGVRVVKKTEKGIVVSGAKVSLSYGPCSKYIFVVPNGALSEEEKDFAVAFALPSDAEGLTYIVKPAPVKENPDYDMECPIGSAIGIVEGMAIFEDVFVPWEHVFLCGEYDMAQRVPHFFSNIQRQSKCACLAGHTDLVCGTAALVADVNGLGANVPHIRDKLTRLMMQAEVAYGCALGSAVEGSLHPSGVYVPSTIIANAGLNYIKGLAGDHIQLIHDIAGGIIVTMPTEGDYQNPKIRQWMDTYLAGNDKYTAEERIRALYLAQEISSTKFTGYFLGWAINASGSPVTGEITVRSEYDLQKRLDIAKKWAGIKRKNSEEMR